MSHSVLLVGSFAFLTLFMERCMFFLLTPSTARGTCNSEHRKDDPSLASLSLRNNELVASAFSDW